MIFLLCVSCINMFIAWKQRGEPAVWGGVTGEGEYWNGGWGYWIGGRPYELLREKGGEGAISWGHCEPRILEDIQRGRDTKQS